MNNQTNSPPVFTSTEFGYLKPAEHVWRSQSLWNSKANERDTAAASVADAQAENFEHVTQSTAAVGRISGDLKPEIHEDGSVTYSDQNGAVLNDSMEQVTMLRSDEQAIEVGVKVAVEKFGSELEVGGSAEFKQQVVEIAVRDGLDVKFSDPEMEAQRQQLTEAREHAEASIERMERISPREAEPQQEVEQLTAAEMAALNPEPQQVEAVEAEQLTEAELAALYDAPSQNVETEQLTAAEMAALQPQAAPVQDLEAYLTPAEQQALNECKRVIESPDHGYER